MKLPAQRLAGGPLVHIDVSGHRSLRSALLFPKPPSSIFHGRSIIDIDKRAVPYNRFSFKTSNKSLFKTFSARFTIQIWRKGLVIGVSNENLFYGTALRAHGTRAREKGRSDDERERERHREKETILGKGRKEPKDRAVVIKMVIDRLHNWCFRLAPSTLCNVKGLMQQHGVF